MVISRSLDAVNEKLNTMTFAINEGATGSFTSQEGSTITIEGGIVTSIVEEGGEVTPPGETPTNDYLELVFIPTYDSGNPEHLLITESNGKWTESNLNNNSYEHFYVEPGDYHSAGVMDLTASGTSDNQRTISLYNGNDLHPASMSENEQANVRIKFHGDYWLVDRMSELHTTSQTDIVLVNNGSSHNVINRWHLHDFYSGQKIDYNASYNTFQNCFLDYQTHAGRLSDNTGFLLSGYECDSSDVKSHGNKFINNDIRNTGDGIQMNKREECDLSEATFNGTIIDGNRIWNDGSIFTDGDYASDGYSGNDNSEYQIGENAMDFKAGSDDENDPVIVTNNIMWGYREGDDTAGGSWTSNSGKAVTIHMGVDNLKFENNIIFDAQQLLVISSPNSAPYAMLNSTIKNNIFHDANYKNPLNDTSEPHIISYGSNIAWENNSHVNVDNSDGSRYIYFDNTGTDGTFDKNVVINANGSSSNSGYSADGNYLYDSSDSLTHTNITSFVNIADANMGNYEFDYLRFTDSPQTKTLTGVITTASSPHNGVAGSTIS